MDSIAIKICGLMDSAHISAAVTAGARYVGFVFFEKSPRHLTIEQAALLAADVPVGIAKVALVVNATDEQLDVITGAVAVDMLQLHGSESPERVMGIRKRYGLPVMKAVGISDAKDLAGLDDYMQVADQILVDAKPNENSELPGGNGLAFDWNLIANRRWTKPWMLAGGLVPDNVARAIRLTGAKQVDVSSGVEVAPGLKDAELIAAFVEAAKGDAE